jgi:hypothetical protein
MSQTRIGNRVIVIAGTAQTHERTGYRETSGQRPVTRRTVVIRNGKSVGRRRGR